MTAKSQPEFNAGNDSLSVGTTAGNHSRVLSLEAQAVHGRRDDHGKVRYLGNGADTHWPSALEIMQNSAVLTEKQVLETPPNQLPIYFQLNLEKGRDISATLADLRSNYQNRYSSNLNLVTTFNEGAVVARVIKETPEKADLTSETDNGANANVAKMQTAKTESCTDKQTARVENILLGLPATADEEDRTLAYNARLMNLPVHYRKEDVSAVEAARIYGIDEQLPNRDIMAHAAAAERAEQLALMGLPADTSDEGYTAALKQRKATEEEVLKTVAQNNVGKSQAEINAAVELQKSYFFLKNKGMYVSDSTDQQTMQSLMDLYILKRDGQRMGLPANTSVAEIARIRAARVNNLPDNVDALTIQETKATNAAMISRATSQCES